MEWGRAVSFLAVHKSDFLYSVAHRAGVNRQREAVAAVARFKSGLAAPMGPFSGGGGRVPILFTNYLFLPAE